MLFREIVPRVVDLVENGTSSMVQMARGTACLAAFGCRAETETVAALSGKTTSASASIRNGAASPVPIFVARRRDPRDVQPPGLQRNVGQARTVGREIPAGLEFVRRIRQARFPLPSKRLQNRSEDSISMYFDRTVR
jgi:hypothetical protein